MLGNVPLTKLDGVKPVPMVDVVARVKYLKKRCVAYKALLDRNRTDPDYCSELEHELSEIEILLRALESIKGLTSSERHAQYNYACTLEVNV